MFTAQELAEMKFPPVTRQELVDLVDSGVCTPQCLFGTERSVCDCRCGEKWHGYARTEDES